MGKKEKKNKKRLLKKIICFSSIFLLISIIVCAILIYRALVDENKNTYAKQDNDITEIIKKDYIDGFKDISTSGKFSFYLTEDDINELLSKTEIDNKYIENVYYKRGEDNHHYFYFDLDIPLIQTRFVLDTVVSNIDDNNKTINLQIINGTIGKLPTWNFLKSKNYFNEGLINSLLSNSQLPFSYTQETDSFIIEPLKFLDMFTKDGVAGMMFDFAKSDMSSISVNPSTLGFEVDFSKFKISNYEGISETSEVPDLEGRIKTAYDSLDYDSLTPNTPQTISTLKNKELNSYLYESFEKWEDIEVVSELTSNTVKCSVNQVALDFINDDNIRLVYFVSLNGYICNVTQDLSIGDEGEYMYAFGIFGSPTIKSGDVVFSGVENKHVNQMLEIIGNIFYKIGNKYPMCFKGIKTNYSLSFNFNFLLSYIISNCDLQLSLCHTNVSINSNDRCLEFKITRI